MRWDVFHPRAVALFIQLFQKSRLLSQYKVTYSSLVHFNTSNKHTEYNLVYGILKVIIMIPSALYYINAAMEMETLSVSVSL